MKHLLALATMPALIAIALTGCSTASPSVTSAAAPTTSTTAVPDSSSVSPIDSTSRCSGTATPSAAVTEGPYYVAGDFMRSDITEGQVGLPMALTIRVVDTNCNPIPNATVDIWHTNALGQYSGVSDPKEGCAECVDKTFLRGSQITNENGEVSFQTIFPGWYSGRTVHIHVKVWQNGQQILTSQFFVDQATADAVYATAGYRGSQDTTNESDRIARGLGSSLAALMWSNTIEEGVDTAFAQLVIAK